MQYTGTFLWQNNVFINQMRHSNYCTRSRLQRTLVPTDTDGGKRVNGADDAVKGVYAMVLLK